mgnify:CR=1 FL=1
MVPSRNKVLIEMQTELKERLIDALIECITKIVFSIIFSLSDLFDHCNLYHSYDANHIADCHTSIIAAS